MTGKPQPARPVWSEVADEDMEKAAHELMERSEELEWNCEQFISDLDEFERRSRETKIRIGEKI